jgi:hypothetical protein
LRRGGRRDLVIRSKSLHDTTASLEFPSYALGIIRTLTPSLQKKVPALPSRASEWELDTYTSQHAATLANVCFIGVPGIKHNDNRQIQTRFLLRISMFTNDSRACNIEEASQRGDAVVQESIRPVRTRRTKKPYAP